MQNNAHGIGEGLISVDWIYYDPYHLSAVICVKLFTLLLTLTDHYLMTSDSIEELGVNDGSYLKSSNQSMCAVILLSNIIDRCLYHYECLPVVSNLFIYII